MVMTGGVAKGALIVILPAYVPGWRLAGSAVTSTNRGAAPLRGDTFSQSTNPTNEVSMVEPTPEMELMTLMVCAGGASPALGDANWS